MESVEDDAQTNQSTQSRSTKSHSKVVIKELAEVTTKEDIKRTFASAGTVTHVFFPKEWLGFAIVTFSSPSGGRKATELLDQSKLGGSKIRVLLYNKAKKSQTKKLNPPAIPSRDRSTSGPTGSTSRRLAESRKRRNSSTSPVQSTDKRRKTLNSEESEGPAADKKGKAKATQVKLEA